MLTETRVYFQRHRILQGEVQINEHELSRC